MTLARIPTAAAVAARTAFDAELARATAEISDPDALRQHMQDFTAELGARFTQAILVANTEADVGSQFDGLADRNRIFPQDSSRTQLGEIEVTSIKMGGTILYPAGGTRYANGRLVVAGLADNSVEVCIQPGPDCTGRGVIAQILMFSRRTAAGWLRHCLSWVNDGSPDVAIAEGEWKGFEVGGDYFIEDQGSSGKRMCMPWHRKTGEWTSEADGSISPRNGKTYNYGEDDSGRYIDSYFSNGSDELYLPLPDGRRVTTRSLIPAFVAYCEKNGIPIEIRK